MLRHAHRSNRIRNRTGFGLGAAARQPLDFGTVEAAEQTTSPSRSSTGTLMAEASPARLVRIDVHDGRRPRLRLPRSACELLKHLAHRGRSRCRLTQSPSRRGGDSHSAAAGDIACARLRRLHGIRDELDRARRHLADRRNLVAVHDGGERGPTIRIATRSGRSAPAAALVLRLDEHRHRGQPVGEHEVIAGRPGPPAVCAAARGQCEIPAAARWRARGASPIATAS